MLVKPSFIFFYTCNTFKGGKKYVYSVLLFKKCSTGGSGGISVRSMCPEISKKVFPEISSSVSTSHG